MLRRGLREHISTEIPSDGDIVCRSIRIDIARRVISVLEPRIEFYFEFHIIHVCASSRAIF